jgi:hypothetical protein
MADPEAARRFARDVESALMRVVALALLLLAGCGSGAREATVNETDPAITDAVNDPILADPRLSLQERGGAIGVPTGVAENIGARTLGQIASARMIDPAFAGCDAKVDYAFAWSARLPADLPLPEAAKVTEAAGSDAKACKLRLVRYVINQPTDNVTSFYRDLAKKRGFTLTESEGSISGVRTRDGAAFHVAATDGKGATAVDFITNRN